MYNIFVGIFRIVRDGISNAWLHLAGWLEYLIVTRAVPQRVGPVMRLVFKTPILFYQLGLGGLVGRKILVLVTTGRRTGRKRETPLEYGLDARTGVYFLMSGWSGRSDWYRNARTHPHVQLWVGRQRINARAEPATDEDVVRVMDEVLQAYPPAVRTWSRFSGEPYDGTRASLLRMAVFFPSLLVYPECSSAEAESTPEASGS